MAKEHLAATQAKMKALYDQKSVSRQFQPGDSVMVLHSVPGSALQTKFIGPYIVDRQLSEINYVVRTPDRRRKTNLCHVNMLKTSVTRDELKPPKSAHVSTVDIFHPVTSSAYCPEQVGLFKIMLKRHLLDYRILIFFITLSYILHTFLRSNGGCC